MKQERALAGTVAVLLVLSALAFLLIPNFVGSRRSPIVWCINNLRQLDGAAEQWRLEFGQATNAIPTMDEAGRYLKHLPSCPGGGNYRFDPTTGLPHCSIRKHILR